MSHMQGYITEKKNWLEVESAIYGTAWVDADSVSWPASINVEVPRESIDPEMLEEIIQYTEIHCIEAVDFVKLIRGYGVRLSAPGYLDCTEWAVFKTLKEAREHIQA